jgi:hypothetical protein
MSAKTPEDVRKICEDAFVSIERKTEDGGIQNIPVPNWPMTVGSVLPLYLSKYAESFIAAKNDPHFPASKRPTSRLKQFWFLSRALAGAAFGIEPRTAINLVGSRLPDKVIEAGRLAKRVPQKSTRRSIR